MLLWILREKLLENMRPFKLYSVIFLSMAFCLLMLLSIEENSLPPPSSRSRSTISRHLPLLHWQHRAEYPEIYGNSTCGRSPNPKDLKLTNQFWQKVLVPDGNVHVYSAYWDHRFDEPLVRVIVYSDTYTFPELHCQLWYINETQPYTTKAEVFNIGVGKGNGRFEPYIISCKTRKRTPPSAISLVGEPCGIASNILNVQGTQHNTYMPSSPPFKGSTAVCVIMPKHSLDEPALLIEWLEILLNYEVQKVFFYIEYAPANIMRVLDRYMAKEFIDIAYMSKPHVEVDDRNHLLEYNDCLYRSIGWYQWIVTLNLEEMIVPIGDENWVELTTRAVESSPNPLDGLRLDVNWFPEEAQHDLPRGLNASQTRILAHVWRAKHVPVEAEFWRSFVNTKTVVAVQMKEPVKCGTSSRSCTIVRMSQTIAKLHRYGRCVMMQRRTCRALTNATERDSSLEHVRQDVLKSVNKQLRMLKLTEL